MKKILLILFIFIGSTLFAQYEVGVRIGGKNSISIGVQSNDGYFRSDHHRYDKRYRNFDYKRRAYSDNYGYYYGYFDRLGYFYNNIFFEFNNKYRYIDRVKRRAYFSHEHAHFRPYVYQKHNNWNKKHKFRKRNQKIYGHYYDRDNKHVNKRNKHKKYHKKNKGNKHGKHNNRGRQNR